MRQRKSKTKRSSRAANPFSSPGAPSSGAASPGALDTGTANPAPASIVRVGPAGWSYPDWAGYVYPSRRANGFHEAAYLAEFFDTIEINTSFYQPLRPDHTAQWIERVAVNPRFVFTAKLWQRFTHDVRSVTSRSAAEDERAVRAGFDVLRAANKLGAVLLQFPFSFHRTAETVAYLTAVLKRFADYPLVVEVRHGSWDAPETLELLRTSGDYLYTTEELAPWVTRVHKVTERAGGTFVITNNHFQGKAVVNALQLISILKGSKVKVPEALRRHYPQLESIADSPPAEPMLFPLGKGSKDVGR